jgi:hypothetical protein
MGIHYKGRLVVLPANIGLRVEVNVSDKHTSLPRKGIKI